MRNIVYDLLSDIIYRFRVSFGYDALMFSNHTANPWPSHVVIAINELVMNKMLDIPFHWRRVRREDGAWAGVARIPKWRDLANFTQH